MLFVVELTFGTHPDRMEARPAHRQRLQELHEKRNVLMAGPWADDSGALLIFDVENENRLKTLMDEDPYFQTPGVSVKAVRAWTPIVR